jgi:hypothetical protein
MLCATTQASAIAGATAHARVDVNAHSGITTTASASEVAQTKTRVRGFDEFSPLNICTFASATLESHRGFSSAPTELVSGASYQAEGSQIAGVATRFGPVNPGPLAADVVDTFRSGSYSEVTLSEATTLYRVYGGEAGALGRYWTTSMPSGPMQAQMDLALDPAWGNTATQVASMQVPAGTTVYAGYAAPQYMTSGVGSLSGGGVQVYIPTVGFSWIIQSGMGY